MVETLVTFMRGGVEHGVQEIGTTVLVGDRRAAFWFPALDDGVLAGGCFVLTGTVLRKGSEEIPFPAGRRADLRAPLLRGRRA